jgi:hypothetical protein
MKDEPTKRLNSKGKWDVDSRRKDAGLLPGRPSWTAARGIPPIMSKNRGIDCGAITAWPNAQATVLLLHIGVANAMFESVGASLPFEPMSPLQNV